MTAARQTWFARVAAGAPERLIFPDETWFSTAMGRLSGDAPVGERPHAAVPFRRWTALTVVAGLTAAGLLGPRAFAGPMTGRAGDDDLRRTLLPKCRPGDVLILGNLSSHKTRAVRATPSRAGLAVRYVPAYRPDRNPIEQASSKLKRVARSAAERSGEGLTKLGRSVARKLRPAECRDDTLHTGYSATLM